jgi:hypothetical protein
MAFVKGQSGNPGGRAKKSPEHVEIELLARAHGAEAIKRLAFWMGSDDGRVSIAACDKMLERGFGKPDSTLNVNVSHDLSQFSDAQLAAILAGAEGGGDGSVEAADDKGQLH